MACFLLAIPFSFALIVKVYGLADLRGFVLYVGLPCLALLIGTAWLSRSRVPELQSDLLVGAVGGLIGTVAYDLVRMPAVLAGYRLYGTISVFGLWLLDATRSSRYTEVAGWSYNYGNGICFGMMYALFMRGKYWGYGVLWAFALETIAVVTPFGRIFSVRNAPVLLLAYGAHIAYGVPLGRAVQNWRDTRTALSEILLHPLISPAAAAADRRATDGRLRVDGESLAPGWLRITSAGQVRIENPQDRAVRVQLADLGQHLAIGPGASVTTPPLAPGIHQVFVETPGRTHSSFIVVEPVEEGR
jgi:hypothetical protein